MSYDLRVWGRKTANLAECLPPSQGWTERADGWALEKRSWQIVVSGPQHVEPEDVPADAADALPGLTVLVEISLEPGAAPRAAHSTLLSRARAVACALAGLVEDPQEGSVTLARGEKRYAKPKREERFAVVDLSWWFVASPLRTAGGTAELIRILSSHLPEAVPRRYGLWEPPQYTTHETGPEALADFMRENLDNSAVFYPTRPVVGFSLSDCDAQEHPWLGFRSNRLSIQLEIEALRQPGWERAAKRLWRDVSRLLQPFYGEARVLSGLTWFGATTGSDVKTDVHPVRSWFWRGIPPTPGLAIVLGPPYAALWPMVDAERSGKLVFVAHPDWSSGESLHLQVPSELAQRWEPSWMQGEHGGYTVNWCDEYPSTWPFALGTHR